MHAFGRDLESKLLKTDGPTKRYTGGQWVTKHVHSNKWSVIIILLVVCCSDNHHWSCTLPIRRRFQHCLNCGIYVVSRGSHWRSDIQGTSRWLWTNSRRSLRSSHGKETDRQTGYCMGERHQTKGARRTRRVCCTEA